VSLDGGRFKRDACRTLTQLSLLGAKYLSTTAQAAPQAQIVHDKFHVAKHLNEAVDRVRRAENRQVHCQGSDLLSGTKYVWLKNPDNWHETDQSKFDALRSCGFKVARA
jgi:transposase